jgi:hypothetical protein
MRLSTLIRVPRGGQPLTDVVMVIVLAAAVSSALIMLFWPSFEAPKNQMIVRGITSVTPMPLPKPSLPAGPTPIPNAALPLKLSPGRSNSLSESRPLTHSHERRDNPRRMSLSTLVQAPLLLIRLALLAPTAVSVCKASDDLVYWTPARIVNIEYPYWDCNRARTACEGRVHLGDRRVRLWSQNPFGLPSSLARLCWIVFVSGNFASRRVWIRRSPRSSS